MFITSSFDVLQTGSTALHLAAENGHLKTVEFLLIVAAMDHPDKVYTVEPLKTFVQRALCLIRRLSFMIMEVLQNLSRIPCNLNNNKCRVTFPG